MNEDLLTTNSIGEGFQEYVDTLNRANNVYDKNKPEFLENQVNDEKFGNIDKSSVGYDQFKNMEYIGMKKRKKIQKTVINIDSKNRKKKYSYNEIIIDFDPLASSKLRFYKDSNYFYIITKNTFIPDIRDRKEIILYNMEDSITELLGIDKSIFEFNKSNGKPIFYVNRFLYNSKSIKDDDVLGYKNPLDKSNEVNKYDVASERYMFNIIEVSIPGSVNSNEINGLSYDSVVNASFIYDVNVSYTSPSHYKLDLNKNYSNVYAVRMVSSEIPNTAYSFNGIRTSTNVGKNTLTTRVNNKLRWLNETDLHNFSSYKISEFRLYDDLKPNPINDIDRKSFQLHQSVINKKLFNKNIHNEKIRTYAYTDLNLKDISKQFNDTNGRSFTYSSSFSENFYYMFNYYEHLNFLNEEYNHVFSEDFYGTINTLYLDNGQLIDGIKINAVDKDDSSDLIKDNDKIIISVQSNKSLNNIYIVTKDTLVTFLIVNPGNDYTNDDLNKFKLYQFDYEFKEYIEYQGLSLQDITPEIYNGSISNIDIKTPIQLDPKIDIDNMYNPLDYFYGSMGYLANTYFIDQSKKNIQYNDSITYYQIVDYNVTDNTGMSAINYNIIDSEGKFNTNTIDGLELDKFEIFFNNLIGTYGGINNNIDISDKSTLDLKLEYMNSSGQVKQLSSYKHLSQNTQLGPDKITFSVSKKINDISFDLLTKNMISSGSQTVNQYFNLTSISILEYNNLYVPGEELFTIITFRDKISQPDYEYSLKLKIYIKPELINLSKINNESLNSYVVNGNNFYCRSCISSKYEPIINSNNEISRYKNKSYLKYKEIEETYFYIYKSLDGEKSKDNYYLINNDNNYYQFLFTNVIRSYERTSPYLRQTDININQNIPISDRDYYNNFNLIGEPNETGLNTDKTKFYKNSASFVSHNIYSQIKNLLDTYSVVKGGISSTYTSDNSYVYFSFNDNFNMIVSLFSNKNSNDSENLYYDNKLIKNLFDKKTFPINVTMIALEDVIYYNFMVTGISKLEISSSSRLKESYLLNIIPIKGDFEYNLKNSPFKLADKSNSALMILNYPISSFKFNRLNTFFPDYIHYFRNYYTEYIIDRIGKEYNISKYNPGDSLPIITDSVNTDIYNFNNLSDQKNQLMYIPFLSPNPNTYPNIDVNNIPEDCIVKHLNNFTLPDNYYYIKLSPDKSFKYVVKSVEDFEINSIDDVTKLYISRDIDLQHYIGNNINEYKYVELIITFDNDNNNIPKTTVTILLEINQSFIHTEREYDVLVLSKMINYTNTTYKFNKGDTITFNFINYTPKNISQIYLLFGNNSLEFYSIFEKSLIRINSVENNSVILNGVTILLGNYSRVNSFYVYDADYIDHKLLNDNIFCKDITKVDSENRKCLLVYKYFKRCYLKLNVDILINSVIINQDRDKSNDIIMPINTIYNNEYAKAYIRFIEDTLTEKLDKNNFLDVLNYNQYLYSVNDEVTNGIVEEGVYRNYVISEPVSTTVVYARHTEKTNTISGFQNIGSNVTTSNKGLLELMSYPVYELQIDNAKYNETSLRKYFEKKMTNINQKIFDYKKGIYVDDINKNTHAELLKISGYNNPTSFDLIFNKSIGSVSIKQYIKIFEVNKKSLDVDNKFVFYNNGLPYMYFKIPEVSLPNNSIIQIQGTSSLDNIHGDEINGQRKLIIPNKYRISIRQLAPLPKSSYLDNNKFLFQNKGYSREEDSFINNEYTEYIQNAISEDKVKNIANEYITDHVRKIKEKIYRNNYFSLENITKIDKIFNLIEKNINTSNQHKFNLKKSFVNNRGLNEQFEEVVNFDNLGKIATSISNKKPFEYYGQALINCSNNQVSYRQTEFLDDEKELLTGIQSAFFENELFMRISDINSSYKRTIIGRITNLNNIADKNGNHILDYDLFVEELNNFRIGDIIIGLDSGAIAVILPDEYQFNNLPNDDIITLGIVNYYLNLNSNNNTDIVNFFMSATNTITETNELVYKFINKYQYWIPERIYTSSGFYIKLDSVPNNSRLNGILTSRLQVLIPHNFKFLESDDDPLESFGFLDSNVNGEFNYFKDNFSNVYETEIKWSYIINNETDVKQFLIIETKNTDNFNIEDEVYIRNHNITLKDIDYRKELYFNTIDIISFGAYISKFEEIYNNFILEKVGFSYFNNMFISNKISIDNDNILLTPENINLNYFNDDKSSIDSNYITTNIQDSTDNVDILYYTNNQGSITDIYLTNIEGTHLNDNVILETEYGNDVLLNISDDGNIKLSNQINNNNFNFGMYKIPFKNRFVGINFSQEINNFNKSYNLLYTKSDFKFETGEGRYFKIEYDNNSNKIRKIIIKTRSKNGNTEDYDIIQNYIDDNTSKLKNIYKNQLVSFTLTNESDIKITFVLKEFYESENGTYNYKLRFINPGSDYYSSFNKSLLEDQRYLLEFNVERTFTTFSDYEDINISNTNLDIKKIQLQVAGSNIDNIVSLTDYNTFRENILSDQYLAYTSAGSYLSDIDNIRLDFNGVVLDSSNDNVIIEKAYVVDSLNYPGIVTSNPGKNLYIFNITLQGIDLSDLTNLSTGETLKLETIGGSTLATIQNDNYRIVNRCKNVTNTHVEPNSIFNRVIETYLTNKQTQSLLKNNRLFSKYSRSIYSNRIIKIKMSPIDNKGFCYQKNSINLSDYSQNSVIGPTRAVPGYDKLLFPYHEFNNILDFSTSIDGIKYKVGSEILKRYSRVRQSLNKDTYSSRNFLPGMGIYTIDEVIEPTKIIGTGDHTGDDNSIKNIFSYNTLKGTEGLNNIKLTNTVYRYSTNFIGYVLNTSIESIDEDTQSYRLNSDTFSKLDRPEEITSEYYVYVLLDPSVTTKEGINRIFDCLNKDDVHYVFDGNANKNYQSESPLISPGRLTSGNKYKVKYEAGNGTSTEKYVLDTSDNNSNNSTYYRVTLNQVTASNKKNIYGTRGILGTAGEIKFYDDDNLNLFLNQSTLSDTEPPGHAFDIFNTNLTTKNTYQYIDVLQENLLGCITIIKDKLNKTLLNFSYSGRVACGTHTERPVFYKKSNNTMKSLQNKLIDKISYDEKLFVDGSLDLYFQDELKNKAVINYEPILDTVTYKNLNDKNIIIEDHVNTNTRVNNKHEINQHSNVIKNYSKEDFYYHNKYVKSEVVNGIKPEYTFEPNTDIILINNSRKEYLYEDGPNYQNFLGKSTSDSKDTRSFTNIGYSNDPIKIKTGRLLPQLDFKNINYSFNNEYSQLTKNWALMDIDYDENLNLLGSYTTFGKHKTSRYDVVGNNYENYNKSSLDSKEENVYRDVVFVEKIGNQKDINGNSKGFLIAKYDISTFKKNSNNTFISESEGKDNLLHIELLKDNIFILSGYSQDSKGSVPFNIPYNTELCIIEDAVVYEANNKFNILTLNDEFESELEEFVFLEKVIKFTFKNKIVNTHTDHNEELRLYNSQYSKYYIYNQVLYSTKELTKCSNTEYDVIINNPENSYLKEYEDISFYKLEVSSSNMDYLINNSYFDNKKQSFIFDFGNKRHVEKRDTYPPYMINNNYEKVPTSAFLTSIDIQSSNGKLYIILTNTIDNSIPIFYPEDTKIVLLKNTLLGPDQQDNVDNLPIDNKSTKSFIHKGEWYTKIYFNSAYNNDNTLISSQGKEKYIINNYNSDRVVSTNKNIYSTTNMFIHSMKGLRIPFICLDIDTRNNLDDKYNEPIFISPIENNQYGTYIKNLLNDYGKNSLIQDFTEFEGEFVTELTSQIGNSRYSWKYIPGKKNRNFDFFIVKGLYQGFGGICEERYNEKFINNSINNDIPARIARIQNLNNKFFIFIELDTYKSPLIFTKNKDVEKTYTINQSGRSDTLNYDVYLNLLENNLSKLDNLTMNKLTKYGQGGILSRKKIENPYNLNPNNYVYLVIPVFDNIELIQNNSLQGAFAKILLPGESNKTLFNTYTSASKIFTNNLYNNLSEIEIAFITNDGYLFDFNGAEHSFSLEITEVIDKFEHINPKFGNIEF